MDLKIKMNLFNNIDLWEKIIYELNGTCNSIEYVLDNNNAEELQDHLPFLNHLDNEIFRCDGCSWWCSIAEMSEKSDTECNDCAPDDE